MEVSRRVAIGTALIGAAAFLLVTTWAVPWDPVPGGSPQPVPARSVFTAAQIERAEDYSRWARVWSWSSLAVSLAVAGWLGFGPRGPAIAARTRGPWPVRVLLVVAVLALVGRLATLPLGVALQALRRDAGLSTASWPAWTRDLVLGELVGIVATSVAVVAVIGCARRWRQLWPIAAGAALAALVALGSFVYPVLVEPLFNDFESLREGSLRSRVLDLADEEGVRVDDVLVADASRRTTTLNAYVSGFGSTRRVVLYDTLVEDLPEDQALAVVAHELAHAKHHDVVVGTALGACGAVVAVGLLGLLMSLRPRGPAVLAVEGVPYLLALAALAAVLAAPVQSGISRQIETRADVVALEATNAPQPFVALQRRLSLRSLADPTPPAWSQWWFGSHPTVLERIALAGRLGRQGR